MRSKFQKRSVLKLADRIILHKHGYNTPPLGADLVSMYCPWVHTRDLQGAFPKRAVYRT
jgi:hypothetical protein